MRVDHGARHVGDHRAPGPDVVVDRAAQAHSNGHAPPSAWRTRRRASACRKASRLTCSLSSEARGFPRHHAAREHDVAVVGAGRSRETDQGVLAGAARTDHQDEPARPDRGRTNIRYGRGFASRHAMPLAPDAAHHRNVAGDMDADQIGALADRDLAAVVETDRLGRRLGDGADGGSKIDRRTRAAAIATPPSTGSRECSRTTGCPAAPRGRDRRRRYCRNANRRAPRWARPSGCRCRPGASRARPRSWSEIPRPQRGRGSRR